MCVRARVRMDTQRTRLSFSGQKIIGKDAITLALANVARFFLFGNLELT